MIATLEKKQASASEKLLQARVLEKKKQEQEQKNKLFESMSSRKRAVAIAQDVLDQLKAEKITARRSIYVSAPHDILVKMQDRYYLTVPLEEIAEMHCDCCAIGASVLSFSRLFNRMSAEPCDIEQGDGGGRSRFFPNRIMLSEAFSWQTIALIEVAFESDAKFFGEASYHRGKDIRINSADIKAAVAMRGRKSDKSLLRIIMQNIVDNKGMFKPQA